MQPDTRKLLMTGWGIFLSGAAAVGLLFLAFGGVSRQGPQSSGGWLCLMLAMGCLPTGLLTIVLGLAKLVGGARRN
jgi:hypothetical protein